MPSQAPPSIPAPVVSGSPGPGHIDSAENQELEALFGESSERQIEQPKAGRAKAGKPGAAPSPSSGGRYKVRRRSGKIFGPFGEDQIIDMLGKGELLGNEDVSMDDGANWSPIGSVASFSEAMRALMDAPSESPQGAPAPAGPAATPFVSRMAESKIVSEGQSRWRAPFRNKTLLIASAAILLLVVGAGLGAGLTRYGVFFHKAFRVRSPNRPAAKILLETRAVLAGDHFESARRAVELAEQAFKLDDDDPEAKGLYVQAIVSLMRHGGATASLTARAEIFAKELMASDTQEPDTIKARVALDLVTQAKPGLDLLRALEKLGQKPPPDEEALWLLGEAAAARQDWKAATGWYKAILAVHSDSARATHGLAAALAAQGDLKGARDLYQKALAQDPKHSASAIEQAALADQGGDVAAAETALRTALEAGSANLSADERARGRSLLAGILARRPGADGQSRLAEAQSNFEGAVTEAPAYLPARIAYARFLLRRGAAENAANVLQPAAQTSANDVEFAALYGQALAASGRILDAMNVIDPVLAKFPSSAPLLFAKGSVTEQGGKRNEARGLYERAAAADKTDWQSHLALARIDLKSGDLGRAETEMKLAVERGPQAPEPRVGLGDWKLARTDLAGAEADYREAMKLDPDHAAAHLGMARVLVARGDDISARSELEKALQLDPRQAAAQLALGELFWRTKNLDAAKKAFQSAVSLAPQDALARARLGAVELEAGQVDAAVNDLLAASNLDLTSAEVHFWLGRALLAKGEAGQAVDELKRACERNRDNATYHLYFGMALERGGTTLEAMEEYKLAIAKDPKLVEGYERLGQLLVSQNRCEEAIQQFDKVLALSPNLYRVRVAVGDCHQKTGKHAEAIAVYREVLKADPSQVGMYYRIGRSVHELSGPRQATSWYERASREDAANPMPHYYLGFYYKERGLKAKAIQEFKAYLKAKPDADDRKDVEREIEYLGG